ncbi:hypothetical protein GGR57DRAFT_484407 [Xylariaceae sp. FL1272]|nr:hypothetical protein GGR57DRAFT_484407 [Xylariaceae sp. FL1272]
MDSEVGGSQTDRPSASAELAVACDVWYLQNRPSVFKVGISVLTRLLNHFYLHVPRYLVLSSVELSYRLAHPRPGLASAIVCRYYSNFFRRRTRRSELLPAEHKVSNKPSSSEDSLRSLLVSDRLDTYTADPSARPSPSLCSCQRSCPQPAQPAGTGMPRPQCLAARCSAAIGGGRQGLATSHDTRGTCSRSLKPALETPKMGTFMQLLVQCEPRSPAHCLVTSPSRLKPLPAFPGVVCAQARRPPRLCCVAALEVVQCTPSAARPVLTRSIRLTIIGRTQGGVAAPRLDPTQSSHRLHTT